jgi:hypothetical protein
MLKLIGALAALTVLARSISKFELPDEPPAPAAK